MSDVQIHNHSEKHRATFVELVEFRLLVAGLFICAAITLGFARLLGGKREQPFWAEVKSAAHAIAGYAFKY